MFTNLILVVNIVVLPVNNILSLQYKVNKTFFFKYKINNDWLALYTLICVS